MRADLGVLLMQSKYLLLRLSFVCLVLAGCGTKKPDSPRYEVEILTPAEAVLEEVMSTPTEFIVDYDNDPTAWDRIPYFFTRYLGVKMPVVEYLGNNSYRIRAPSGSTKYSYNILKTPESTGFRYRVECIPNQSSAKSSLADRNARNLARFIRDGTLELSLLDR
ncbi:MAG: hypothetical protein D6719_04460 [Candidatus Dadabacteria bacterium]|nr:MAG: hypothetical protein D6719_04460 [Candidatus Dadabacteria bacterium]